MDQINRDRKIYQIDPETGAILRTIESNRFVTGVTWIDGELWHGTWEGDQSDLRRVDPRTGEVLERVEMPSGVAVSGLESDGGDLFFCGGGNSGKVRAVGRPKRGSRRKRALSAKKQVISSFVPLALVSTFCQIYGALKQHMIAERIGRFG
jgi:hypothetical protein